MNRNLQVPQGDAARIAFWINAYNDGLRRLLEERAMRVSVLLDLRRFGRPVVEAEGLTFSLNQIEHGLLRGNRRPPSGLRPTIADGDPRLALAPLKVDPRVHFALNCGARSCPPIRQYASEAIDEQLELATRSYLTSESSADANRHRVELPGLMKIYRVDFGDRAAQLEFAGARIAKVADVVASSGDRLRVSYRRFDWRRA